MLRPAARVPAARLASTGVSRLVASRATDSFFLLLGTLPSSSRASCSFSIHWCIEAGCFTCNGFIVSCSATSPSSSHVSRSFSIHWLIEAGLLHVQQIRFPFLGPSPCSSRIHRSFSSLMSWVQLDYQEQFALRAMQSLSPA